MRETETAIWARGCCKTYGGKTGKMVLDHLDMTVEKGTIYGLLGASGCGKTTLLSSIVGSKKLDAGQIRLFGKLPGRTKVRAIGYMPQDIALVGEFSVKSAIEHYGWLFGMTSSEIEKQFEFLNKLLDLPPSDRLIKNLSGGQQRRVSLAVVLVHDPDVLILDEPTVGLDPVLRQNIWDYLVELTEKKKKTIIITTHYIEEAKQAHTIGLMRNGKLLSEGAPEAMMAKYNCSNVEEVFLLLSRKQQEGNTVSGGVESRIPIDIELEDVNLTEEHRDKDKDTEQFVDEKVSVWSSIRSALAFTTAAHTKALVTKNYQKLARNKGSLAYCYVFPVLQMSLFFLTVGGEPNTISLGVVDPELAGFSNCQEFAANRTLGGFKGPDSEHCNYTGLSCKYLLGLPENLQKHKYFETAEEAHIAVKKGQITAYLVFHANFTYKTSRLREDLPITEQDLEEVQINIYMDKSSYPISLFVEKNLLERYGNFSEELEAECGYNPRVASLPIQKLDAVYSSYDAKFSEFMAPGFMLTVSIFLAVSVSALSIVTERTEGSWDRTLVAGVSKTELVIFHFLTMVVVNAMQNLMLFIVTFALFRVDCRGNLFTALVLLTCQGIVGTALGTLVSVISQTVSDCILISLGMFYPFLVMSGVSWPLEGMHPFMRNLSYYIIPSTVTVEALANVINRGWSILNYHVAKGVFSSAAWIIIFNFFSIMVLKYEKR